MCRANNTSGAMPIVTEKMRVNSHIYSFHKGFMNCSAREMWFATEEFACNRRVCKAYKFLGGPQELDAQKQIGLIHEKFVHTASKGKQDDFPRK